MSKKSEKSPVAYYNQTAHQSLLAMISREASRINQVVKIWDKLEAGPLGTEDLPYLIRNDSNYFKKLYEGRVWEMIDALKIPTPTKQKLMQESQSLDFPDLINFLDNSRISPVRSNMISMGGGFRSFEMDPEYFEFLDGKVIEAKDVEGKTRAFFEFLADTPDKAQAIELLNEIAEKMTLATQLLDRSGLYRAIDNPIIDRSALFSLQDGTYKARIDVLL